MIRCFLTILLFGALVQAETPPGGEVAPVTAPAPAKKLLVDPAKGNDANDGRKAAVKTIARGIALAGPGDTIHLAPGIYYESADFTNKHGLPGFPITLDGHGAVLDGSEPTTAATWKELLPGVYRRDHLYPDIEAAIVDRWFILSQGQMNRMDRCAKAPSQPLLNSEALLPGDWTYVKAEDAFYLVLKPGELLDQMGIRYPARGYGVLFKETGSWITVKNITTTHVYDDGFHISGRQRNLAFENITAIECGDDGFSAENDADCSVKGLVSIGNGTGIYNAGNSRTQFKNVFIKDCIGFDLYFIGREHVLENALVESSASRAVWLDGTHLKESGEICTLQLKNVVLRRVEGGPQEIRIGSRSFLEVERCKFLGLNILLNHDGRVNLKHSLVQGIEEKPDILIAPTATWQGEGNRYDLESLRVNNTRFTASTFSEFQAFTKSETGSRWSEMPPYVE
jgi:Right handed beta helix region/Protein of unknown function (DUF1565)